MKLRAIALALVVSSASMTVAKAQDTPSAAVPSLEVYAAGSLRGPLTKIAEDYQKRTGVRIESTFGPSGVLRERIEHGERPDVFASADMASPRKLADQKLGTPAKAFTANAVCAIARPGLGLNAATLLDIMLNPDIKIGAGTPVADPLGDYTETVFANADRLHPGAKKILDRKAVRLIGGQDAPKVPAGQESTSYYLIEGKQADIIFSYCSGAQAAVRAAPSLQVLHLPANLAVNASFGYTVVVGSKPKAGDFGRFLESDAAQKVFLEDGFVKK